MLQKYSYYLSMVLRLSPLSAQAYVQDFQQFSAFVEANNLTLTTVKTEDIQRFFDKRDEVRKLAPATHIRMLQALTHLYNYFLTAGEIDISPTEAIVRPKTFPKIHRTYSQRDLNSLINIPKTKTVLGTRDRCIFELFYATGIRLQELSSLRILDIDLFEKVIFIRGKGSRERLLPLTSHAITWLENYMSVRHQLIKKNRLTPPDTLFLTKTGHTMSSTDVYKMTKRHAEKASLPFFSPLPSSALSTKRLPHRSSTAKKPALPACISSLQSISALSSFACNESDRIRLTELLPLPRVPVTAIIICLTPSSLPLCSLLNEQVSVENPSKAVLP